MSRVSGAGVGVNLARWNGWPKPFPKASRLWGPRACPPDERGKLAPAETGGEREITGRTACSETIGRTPCADTGGSGSRRRRPYPGDRRGIGPGNPRSRQSVNPVSHPPFASGKTGKVQPDRTEQPAAACPAQSSGRLVSADFCIKILRHMCASASCRFWATPSPDLS